ncbi:hypothetical protein BO78DRAFT_466566 [Aspergillus sclerotiicarbonarius CBS 121057]|uniref:Uncharacterized protein n=1 Tax=Aspergillus sclerotiicarbonarius (strain CBS 121057 / IBT 28362) TaxID=1448318 RepID=A0A319F6C2_ASPSB|nr:hypothetical protein BO78DRAFT_466566 [Aspergillus sclerotiicarbonarius CBS 121057]
MPQIYIGDLDKDDLVQALWQKAVFFCLLGPEPEYNAAQAREFCKSVNYDLEVLQYKRFKCDLSTDWADTYCYDRDNGEEGLFERVVKELREELEPVIFGLVGV